MAELTAGGAGGPGAAPFVNHGLKHWLDQRDQWLGKVRRDPALPRPKAVVVSSDALEAVVTDASTVRELPAPVPLPQMVDLLVELWEEEGLFD